MKINHNQLQTQYLYFRFFIAIKVLRIFRLIKKVDFIRFIFRVLKEAFNSFIYLAFLLVICIIVYSFLGMYFFSGNLKRDHELYLIFNFDSFLVSFINITNIMTLDEWSNLVTICIDSKINTIIPALFIISWIFIGNFILLNLFLAILLDKFTNNLELVKKKDKIVDDELIENKNNTSKSKNYRRNKFNSIRKFDSMVTSQISTNSQFSEQKNSFSFYLFSINDNFRKFNLKIATSKIFDFIFIYLVILSGLVLVLETFLKSIEESKKNLIKHFIHVFNLISFILYGIEILIKCISFGFIFGKFTYLKDKWNILGKINYFFVFFLLN